MMALQAVGGVFTRWFFPPKAPRRTQIALPAGPDLW